MKIARVIAYACIRSQSSRLPNKALYNLGGKPAFVHLFERLSQYIQPDLKIIVTTRESTDDPVEFLAQSHGLEVYRGPEDTRSRLWMAMQEYDVRDEDIIIPIAGDAPFVICAHLPFAIKQLRKTGCDQFIPIVKEFSVAWAMWMPVAWPGASRHRFTVPHGGYFDHSHMHCLLGQLSNEYNVEWPWGPLYLDWPAQALQIKQIYKTLYRGQPLDIQEVIEFLKQRPVLAGLTKRDAPLAYGAITGPQFEKRIQEIINIGNYTLVKWDGKEGIEGGDNTD